MAIEESVQCGIGDAEQSNGEEGGKGDSDDDIDDDTEFDIVDRHDPVEAKETFEEIAKSDAAIKNREAEFSVRPGSSASPIELPEEYIKFAPVEEPPIEYLIDTEDEIFIKLINEKRRERGVEEITAAVFEEVMDRLEKNSYFTRIEVRKEVDPNAVCCICFDGDTEDNNHIIFCDLCNIPVHQTCYGVPLIPAGDWFCRRCSISRTTIVKCVLCGRSSGAFKLTENALWVHVICALWINETCFANTDVMEPVEHVGTAKQARKNMRCCVCRERTGACLQCSFKNCFRTFHVTCAAMAEEIEMVSKKDSEDAVFCPEHNSSQVVRDRFAKMKSLKKGMTFKLPPEQDETPPVSEYDIPWEKITEIKNDVQIADMEDIVLYWKDKRDRRYGRPLLRSLQKKMKDMMVEEEDGGEIEPDAVDEAEETEENIEDEDAESSGEDMMVEEENGGEIEPDPVDEAEEIAENIEDEDAESSGEAEDSRLEDMEQDMEHEEHESPSIESELSEEEELVKRHAYHSMIRAREKLKCDLVNVKLKIFMAETRSHTHLSDLLLRTIEKLVKEDTNEVFTQPVSEKDVPGYRSVIKKPMDLSKMRSKTEEDQYTSCSEFFKDFKRMISNCKFFNQHNEFYLNYAMEYEKACKPILDSVRSQNADPEVLQEMNPHPTATRTDQDVTCEAHVVRPSRSRKKRISTNEGDTVKLKKTMKQSGGLIQSSLYKFFPRDLPATENDENGSPRSPMTPSRRSRRPGPRI
uniref:PHD-type domain-containing protein n=1 Tax=Steinernema glaseri TaxID=37863 RepID=A0A1I7YJG0_9BILA